MSGRRSQLWLTSVSQNKDGSSYFQSFIECLMWFCTQTHWRSLGLPSSPSLQVAIISLALGKQCPNHETARKIKQNVPFCLWTLMTNANIILSEVLCIKRPNRWIKEKAVPTFLRVTAMFRTVWLPVALNAKELHSAPSAVRAHIFGSETKQISLTIHPSSTTECLKVVVGAGACPSRHWAKGRVRPGQVACLSQG